MQTQQRLHDNSVNSSGDHIDQKHHKDPHHPQFLEFVETWEERKHHSSHKHRNNSNHNRNRNNSNHNNSNRNRNRNNSNHNNSNHNRNHNNSNHNNSNHNRNQHRSSPQRICQRATMQGRFQPEVT